LDREQLIGSDPSFFKFSALPDARPFIFGSETGAIAKIASYPVWKSWQLRTSNF